MGHWIHVAPNGREGSTSRSSLTDVLERRRLPGGLEPSST